MLFSQLFSNILPNSNESKGDNSVTVKESMKAEADLNCIPTPNTKPFSKLFFNNTPRSWLANFILLRKRDDRQVAGKAQTIPWPIKWTRWLQNHINKHGNNNKQVVEALSLIEKSSLDCLKPEIAEDSLVHFEQDLQKVDPEVEEDLNLSIINDRVDIEEISTPFEYIEQDEVLNSNSISFNNIWDYDDSMLFDNVDLEANDSKPFDYIDLEEYDCKPHKSYNGFTRMEMVEFVEKIRWRLEDYLQPEKDNWLSHYDILEELGCGSYGKVC